MPISTIGSNSLNQTSDLTINGQTVGKGGGNVATNTAHGVSALTTNTTGANNTAVGYQAGYTGTTSARNVAIGNQALYSNSTGNENVAIGDVALYNATGDNNVAVGRAALNATTSGTANTALGKSALQSNTTASSNTAVGYQAGYTNSTGPHNTFVGTQAGYSSTGGENTCVGRTAGYSISTGTGNTFIGPGNGATSNGAGYYVTTGSKNSILGGYNGNQGGLDIRTSSNNIVLSDGEGKPYFWVDTYGNSHIGMTGSTAPPAYSNGGDPGMTIGYMSAYPSVVARVNIQERAQNWITFTNGGGSNYGVISVNGAGVTYGSNSDYRLKEDVTPITGALDRVSRLKPVAFKWIIDGTLSEGFIAHEVQEIIPLAVKGEKDGMADDNSGRPLHQTLDASIIIPTLTAAIKELKTIVDAQAAEIAELKAKVA